ncbi:repeat element 14 protein [Diadegma fenestrale ichnovirus]|nr:repeat element 14 protein [Diadegma fenestrale ichnovirus]
MTDFCTITMSAEGKKTSQAAVDREILQGPKVRKIEAIFLNRKPLEVTYYYEDRGTEHLIMIDVDSLKPIFGAFRPRTTTSFESLDNLCDYVKENIHFDECWDYEYSDCICNLIGNRTVPPSTKVNVLPPSGCQRHFHHSCWSCVNSWLLEYLRMMILYRESKPAFVMAAEEIISSIYGVARVDFERFIHEPSSEFYLWIAQRWTLKGYLRNDIIDSWL